MKKIVGSPPAKTALRRLALIALAGLSIGVMVSPATATTLTGCVAISSSGKYVLANDIKASGTCFTLNADNVGLDLQGHTIRGNWTGRGITDGETGHTGIIISHGGITNFATGIDLSASTFITIEHMNVSHNTDDGIILGTIASITKTAANDNGEDGVFVSGGVSVSEANDNGCNGFSLGIIVAVTDSEAGHNGCDGFSVASGNVITGAKASGNGSNGFSIGNTSVLTMVTADGNSLDGVAVDCPSNVLRLTALGNGSANLVESNPGSCTNLDNNAP